MLSLSPRDFGRTVAWVGSMGRRQKIIETVEHKNFEFDYFRNVIFYRGRIIHLTPHEADILRVLLNNRGRTTSLESLIQSVYGQREPETAATSIRVAIYSLRKKLDGTGVEIRAQYKVGYEVQAAEVPELNRRLSDKILLALNQAEEMSERAIVERLRAALQLAEESQQRVRKIHPTNEQRVFHAHD